MTLNVKYSPIDWTRVENEGFDAVAVEIPPQYNAITPEPHKDGGFIWRKQMTHNALRVPLMRVEARAGSQTASAVPVLAMQAVLEMCHERLHEAEAVRILYDPHDPPGTLHFGLYLLLKK